MAPFCNVCGADGATGQFCGDCGRPTSSAVEARPDVDFAVYDAKVNGDGGLGGPKNQVRMMSLFVL